MEDDVKSTNSNRQTALHMASQTNATLSTARRLLSKGADVNAQDKYGWTPLHIAAYYGADRIVDLLLAEGADVTKVTKGGDSAYLIALAQRHRALLPRLKHDLLAPGDYTAADTSTASSLSVPEIGLPDSSVPLRPETYTASPRYDEREPKLYPRIVDGREQMFSRPPPERLANTRGTSAVFPKLTGVGRKSRKHGSTRVLRRTRRRVSRRNIKA
jgi:hypothetical protein